MNTNAFALVLVLVLVLGGSIGGAFAGGVAFGKSQNEEPMSSRLPSTGGTASQFGQGGTGLPQQDTLRQGIQSGDLSLQDLEQLRQRFASGDLSQEEIDRLREQFRSGGLSQQESDRTARQFQGGAIDGDGARGFPGRTGAIQNVDGNTLTISTEAGTVQASIGADTTIRRFAESTLADLVEGMRVTLIGQAGEDGTVQAISILVVPDDQEGFFGGGFTPRDRQQGGGFSGGAGRP
ncbi:MAG: hypothetical protein BZY88_08235 [SAR202 cluster bacterium Io17-Chloro-G9]|nr:MAG: hypothetical protein BZY88_08235 [SAR202 cluster bacterium Io17-Chloro-G9]